MPDVLDVVVLGRFMRKESSEIPLKISSFRCLRRFKVAFFLMWYQLQIAVNSGDHATDELMQSIVAALNKYILALAKKQIYLAFEQSEKEVTDLHQRTKEGIQTARLNGKQIGQKSGAKLTTKKSIAAKKEILKHSKDFNGTLSDTDTMKLVGLSRNTYYKYKKELKQGN